MADQGSLSERFPLDEWIEAVENLVTQMGYADWCEFRRMQEDETPELAEVCMMRSTEGKGYWNGTGWERDCRYPEIFTPRFAASVEPNPDWEWVRFVEAPF